MLLGYARVSKADDQDTAAQVSALKAAGCTRVYEKASGGRWDRPELHRMLDHLREGDVVLVWKLDRLWRRTRWRDRFEESEVLSENRPVEAEPAGDPVR